MIGKFFEGVGLAACFLTFITLVLLLVAIISCMIFLLAREMHGVQGLTNVGIGIIAVLTFLIGGGLYNVRLGRQNA